MITHERLKELIKQKATIWSNNHCPIKLINDGDHKIDLFEKSLYVAEKFENGLHTTWWWEDYTIGFNDLYESEEDSKWAEEFTRIERTERLELPTWEEIQNKKEFCLGFNNKEGIVRYYLEIDMPYQKDAGEILISCPVTNNYTIICFDKIATKENYTLACRKAKELFLGE